MKLYRLVIPVIIVAQALVSSVWPLEYLSGRGTSLGGTVLLSRPTASELVELPIGLDSPGGWSFESGYHRQFELSDLDQLYFSAALRRGAVSVAIGLSQIGKSDLYSEKSLKLSASWHFDRIVVGPSVSGLIIDIGGDPGRFRAVGYGFGGLFRSERLIIALAADDINSPAAFDGAVAMSPRYSAYLEFLGRQAYSITGKLTLQPDQSPQLGVGQSIHLTRKATFFWGVRSGPLMYGGGIELDIGHGILGYGTTIHPVLGFTHTVSLSIGSSPSRPGDGDDFD